MGSNPAGITPDSSAGGFLRSPLLCFPTDGETPFPAAPSGKHNRRPGIVFLPTHSSAEEAYPYSGKASDSAANPVGITSEEGAEEESQYTGLPCRSLRKRHKRTVRAVLFYAKSLKTAKFAAGYFTNMSHPMATFRTNVLSPLSEKSSGRISGLGILWYYSMGCLHGDRFSPSCTTTSRRVANIL